MSLPYMQKAALALGVTRATLWRACVGRYHNPALVTGYRQFVGKLIADITGGDAALQPAAPLPSRPERVRRPRVARQPRRRAAR